MNQKIWYVFVEKGDAVVSGSCGSLWKRQEDLFMLVILFDWNSNWLKNDSVWVWGKNKQIVFLFIEQALGWNLLALQRLQQATASFILQIFFVFALIA